jgi:hypothetical protein
VLKSQRLVLLKLLKLFFFFFGVGGGRNSFSKVSSAVSFLEKASAGAEVFVVVVFVVCVFPGLFCLALVV